MKKVIVLLIVCFVLGACSMLGDYKKKAAAAACEKAYTNCIEGKDAPGIKGCMVAKESCLSNL